MRTEALGEPERLAWTGDAWDLLRTRLSPKKKLTSSPSFPLNGLSMSLQGFFMERGRMVKHLLQSHVPGQILVPLWPWPSHSCFLLSDILFLSL